MDFSHSIVLNSGTFVVRFELTDPENICKIKITAHDLRNFDPIMRFDHCEILRRLAIRFFGSVHGTVDLSK